MTESMSESMSDRSFKTNLNYHELSKNFHKKIPVSRENRQHLTYHKWYFVTKIVLTYGEKKLF